ncbi:MAG: SLBB domain-containing protein, partial [Verrucomicrobiota bacterium]|nr:SLBB domain-containing protein [Verrucomicrobiota bacterium]
FTVLGAVQRPGTYQFSDRDPLNVLQAVGLAGGYTEFADPAKVTLKRLVSGKQSVFVLDARRMARDSQARQFNIQPGDMITIREKIF